MTEETPDNAKPFTDMAARIDLNRDNKFGGAFVIVPPGEGLEPMHTLILDGQQNAAAFWSMLQTTCQVALNELENVARRQQGGFGGR